MKSIKIIALMLSSILTLGMLSGCTDAAADGNETQTSAVAEAEVLSSEAPNEFKAGADTVKLLGRTCSKDGVLWLANSASGIEFTVTGTSAEFTVIGDSSSADAEEGGYARFAVYVDGERVADELVKQSEKTYTAFTSDTEKTATVSIVKLSEAANSMMGISGIKVNEGGSIAPTEYKELTIEFIGDSITCGYGVDDEDRSHHFSTSTEDATKTYAYKTAQALDADSVFVSYSGHGIVSGYSSDGNKQKGQLVPKYYDLFAFSYGNYNGFTAASEKWDFSAVTPDVIVFNLGTNDSSYTGSKADRVQEYTDGYVEFLKQLRSDNADSYILCTLGIMGKDLYPAIEKAVEAYKADSGDKMISAMCFDVQNQADGYAADWHPTEATHEKAAAKLTEEIKKILAE